MKVDNFRPFYFLVLMSLFLSDSNLYMARIKCQKMTNFISIKTN